MIYFIVQQNARTAHYQKKPADSKTGSIEEKYSKGIPQKTRNEVYQHRRGCSPLPLSEATQCDTDCTSPVAEKTLYVDSVQKVKSHSGLNAFERKVQTNQQTDDFEASRKDSKLLTVADEKATIMPKSSESLDPFPPPCSDSFINDMKIGKTNISSKLGNQGRDLQHNLSPKVGECEKTDSPRYQEATKSVDQALNKYLCASASPKVVGDCKIDLESQRLMKLSSQGNSDIKNLQLPLALPLPKAPSESWLNRTLPIISSRNILLRSSPVAHINGRGQSPKWETIVKSPNLHFEVNG